VEHENGQGNIKFDNKAYRVFASCDNTDGRLLKCKPTEKGDKKDKFGNTPDRCFIYNDDIRNVSIPSKLDRQYYIDLSTKRLRDFGVAV
jgi:DNA polymerase